ncbi:hypothetical protein ACFP9V_04750 [Deinococcus radiopugnans]
MLLRPSTPETFQTTPDPLRTPLEVVTLAPRRKPCLNRPAPR